MKHTCKHVKLKATNSENFTFRNGSNQLPPLLMVEVQLQQGLQTLVALVEKPFPPEAAYHEEHSSEISC
jgi:hypothetical protein